MIVVPKCPIPETRYKPVCSGPQGNLQQGPVPQDLLQGDWIQCCRKPPTADHWQPPEAAAPEARDSALEETGLCRNLMLEKAQSLQELSTGGWTEEQGWQALLQMKGVWGLACAAPTWEDPWQGWDKSYKPLRDCSFWTCDWDSEPLFFPSPIYSWPLCGGNNRRISKVVQWKLRRKTNKPNKKPTFS